VNVCIEIWIHFALSNRTTAESVTTSSTVQTKVHGAKIDFSHNNQVYLPTLVYNLYVYQRNIHLNV